MEEEILEYNAVCKCCGKKFAKNNYNKVYCSDKCRREKARERARERKAKYNAEVYERSYRRENKRIASIKEKEKRQQREENNAFWDFCRKYNMDRYERGLSRVSSYTELNRLWEEYKNNEKR